MVANRKRQPWTARKVQDYLSFLCKEGIRTALSSTSMSGVLDEFYLGVGLVSLSREPFIQNADSEDYLPPPLQEETGTLSRFRCRPAIFTWAQCNQVLRSREDLVRQRPPGVLGLHPRAGRRNSRQVAGGPGFSTWHGKPYRKCCENGASMNKVV